MKTSSAILFLIAALALPLQGEDLLNRAKEILGDAPPYKLDQKNKGNVRETKYPGERYTHFLKSDITGTGRGVVRRKISWFNTEKRTHLHHSAEATIVEEILSSDQDLKNGKLISKFTIIHFSEKIASAKSAITVGPIKSEDAIQLLKEIGEKYGPAMKTTSKRLIEGGLAALAMSFAPIPDGHQVATITVAAIAIPAGFALHFTEWLLNKKLPKITTQDGFYKLSDDDVKAKYPEYESIVTKIRHLEGSVIEAEWQFDKGYTKIDLKNNEEGITNDDKDLIAKMIFRMNPICARTIFPESSKNKSQWSIDAGDIGGMILGTGIDYTHLTGTIHLYNRGPGKRRWPDEKNLGRSTVPVQRIEINRYWDNKIHFAKTFKDKSRLTVGLIPSKGNMLMVLDDGGTKSPVYIRELLIEGKTDSKLQKEPRSLLSTVEFDEANLKMQCSYTQLRERPNQTIEQMVEEISKKAQGSKQK